MNFKSRLLKMDKSLVDKNYIDDTYIDSIENLFLTVETENNSYQPCCYIDEDESWVTLFILPLKYSSQCVSVKKDSIISFGFYNGGTESIDEKDMFVNRDTMYQ